MEPIDQKIWWEYLGSDLQKLFVTSSFLIDTIKGMGSPEISGTSKFADYSFVVFPAAKAYEGFLKKLFLDLGFISEEEYLGKHFRIGKSLNPSLPRHLRKNEVYGKIVHYCGGEKLASELWEAWRVGRNLTFHWYPNERSAISLDEAVERIDLIVHAIDSAFVECHVVSGNS